jgi:predicted butyrate kinase (DUF1464 family)
MPRVAGADPGTSSLDWIVLEEGIVSHQCRFEPKDLKADPHLPVAWLRERGPFDLIAGPSGYGLPLLRAGDSTEEDLALMALVRPDERGKDGGILRFSALLRALQDSSLPIIFLPGVIHLSTVPAHRKINRIDLGTADKVCVAVLALHQFQRQVGNDFDQCTFGLVELGTAFTACLVIQQGQIVDGVGGTMGPLGWQSGGMWDGEVAYLVSPLAKSDLFKGGVLSQPNPETARRQFRESLVKTVGGLQAATPFSHLVLSGRLLETEPIFAEMVEKDLTRFGSVIRLKNLDRAWVKHAAQGAALVADGLAGGSLASLVEHLRLREAKGTILDYLNISRRAF